MKRLFSRLISLILALIVGFWLSYHDVLQGTWVGDQLITISELVPVPENWSLDNGPQFPSTIEETEPVSEEAAFGEEMEYLIFDKINRLRLDEDLKTLAHHPILQKAARKRAFETSVSFSHTRPNGTDPFTVLDENGTAYPYISAGENLAMGPRRGDAEYMADVLFEGWVESPSHYSAMVKPTFKDLGVGVYIADDIVYAAQMLGTQYHY